MSSGSYDPHAIEQDIYAFWERGGHLHAEPDPRRKPFTIVMPPPNVTGALHLGHALNGTLQDILIRYNRMRGLNAEWLPGTDHAGIATQAIVERRLKEEEKLTRHEVGREGLVQRIWAWKDEYQKRILSQLRRVGVSCDWPRTRFTLDDQCAAAVFELFFRLFQDGLIYRGMRLVNWDAHLQTAVADDEIVHETVKGSLWHIRYPVEGCNATGDDARPGRDYLVVATTRPETMLGDTAVAVHPEDARYRDLIGRRCVLPLLNRPIPIIADAILVKPEFGTGCVKVTPAHDPNDYECGRRQGLPMINILTKDGRINAEGGPYEGLPREQARKKVVADLEAAGLLEKVEPYETAVGHSDRSKTPIEPMLSEQWFVRMGRLAELAMEAVRDGRVRFFPERHAKTYLDWLGEKRDWCISRQLWWGHRIPVWTRRMTRDQFRDLLDSASTSVLGKRIRYWAMYKGIAVSVECAGQARTDLGGEEYRDWLEALPNGAEITCRVCLCANEIGADEHQVRVTGLAEAGFEQDPDVLDTWFSSALWPLSTFGWPSQTPELDYFYPSSVLCTDRGIITLWVARMVMAGLYTRGRVPFSHVYIHPTILDGQGRRMSKSAGNGVDPLDVIELYGTDALRYTLASMATELQDARLPVRPVKMPDGRTVNGSERFELGRNFCNKLWQAVTGLVLVNLEAGAGSPRAEAQADLPAGLALEDRWILSRLRECIADVDRRLAHYQFSEYAGAVYAFFWSELCDWYLELIKPRLFSRDAGGAVVRHDDASAQTARRVLALVTDRTLRLMHPVMPFVTEALWQKLRALAPEAAGDAAGRAPQAAGAEPALIAAAWPDASVLPRDIDAERQVALLQDVIRCLRDTRATINATRAAGKQPSLKSLPAAAIRAAGEAERLLHEKLDVLRLLAQCDAVELGPEVVRPRDATTTPLAGVEVYVSWSGLADLDAARERVGGELAELTDHLSKLEEKLADERFVSRAQPAVVERERQRLAELRDRHGKLTANLVELGG